MASVKWHEGMLSKGRILLRGNLRVDNPLHCNLGLYFIADVWSQAPPAFVVVAFVNGIEGSNHVITWSQRGQYWRDAFREDWLVWHGHRYESWLDHEQVVVYSDDNKLSPTLPAGDPRLLLHYGTLLQVLQTPEANEETQSRIGRESAAKKLRPVILEQFRAWKKVVPVP